MNTPIYKNKAFIITILVYITICYIIIKTYNFNLLTSILLLLSGGGIVILINPLLKLPLHYKLKAIQKKQDVIDKHITLAKKANKKCYYKGVNKQHTIWANNHIAAEKIFKEKFTPQQQQSKKEYYYISQSCNNL